MKLNKIFILIFLLGMIIPAMLAAEKWLDKDAEYAISFTLPKKDMPGFWQVDNYAFPFDLKDGFTIWDEAGKKYKFKFDLRKGQLTFAAPKKDNTKIYIYPSKKALEKILKKRHYYVPNRYIRDWDWIKNQASSQCINALILSYAPDSKAKQRAENIAKAEAKAKARFIAKIKARAKVKEKALARAKAKADALAKIIAKEKAEAMAKAVAKIRAESEVKTKAKNIEKVRAKAESVAKVKTKAKSVAKVKTKAEIKSESQARIQAEAKLLAKARAEAKIKAEAEARAKTKNIIKAKYEDRAKARAIMRIKAEARARDKIKIMEKAFKKKNEKGEIRIKKWKYRPRRSPKIGHLPEKDFPADTATLKKIFKYKPYQYIYRRNNPSTNITRPIMRRIKGKYVAYVNIKLNIPKPGKYQFAVKTNDMLQLYVNGERVLDVDKKNASTSKWGETKLFYLSDNPVKIEAYYRNSTDKTNIVIAWRAEGEDNYKFTSQKEYMNFNKIEPELLVSNKGRKLPIIKYNKLGYFQNNQGKQFLIAFETKFPGNKIDWQLNGKTIDSGNKIMMTFTNKIPENISCLVDNKKSFKVTIPKSDLKNPGNLLKRDLYIKLNTPVFIYDDETLNLSAEFHSELQVEVKAFLEAKSNSEIFKGFKISQSFKKTSNEALFRTRDFVKKYFELEGAKLKSGAELEFSIKNSADNAKSKDEKFYFDQKKIIFKKLSECSDLKTENGYFINSKDERVIPILHRPTLNDKRSWSLFNSILGGKKILIIADDFGDKTKLSVELLKNVESMNQELVFEDWKLKAFDADIVNESAKKIKLIRDSNAAVLIIVPSTYPIMRGTSPRLQQRLLAALIQTARNNKNIRKIILTQPFPLARVFSENETIETVFNNIQHLVSEQEISFMSIPDISTDEDTILSNTHPSTKAKEYADIIVKPEQ